MRTALIAIVSSLALTAPAAYAQKTCEERSNLAGTLIGGAAGAALGGAVAGKDDRGTGAVIGAIGGALLGSQVGKQNRSNCHQAYGFYDNQGAWHAGTVDANAARGFYDRDGRWVNGVPNGYYDNRGVWVNATNDMRQGYYDEYGRWVPPQVNGYYNTSNQWVEVRYDQDRGRDGRGRGRGWDDWSSRPNDVRAQADWLRDRINRARAERWITDREARAFTADLNEITARYDAERRRGTLDRNDRVYYQAQLDELRDDFREEMRG